MSKRIENISDLRPDATNANKGTQRGRGMVEASLRETGAGRSILADKDGRIIAGNKTLEAWVDIGGEIEVVRTNGDKLVVVQREDLDLSDDTGTARKLAYYDNRAGEVGLEWDAEQLLADLSAGVDLSSMFRQDELDALLEGLTPTPEPVGDAEAQIDKAEELRQKWGVNSGDLWQLGDHRLVCGDCTDAAVVARVMGGEKADMVFTDPPYGIAYHSNMTQKGPQKWDYKPIEGDSSFDTRWLATADEWLADGSALYICTRWDVYPQWYAAIAEIFKIKNCCVWVKNLGGMGDLSGAYAPQHEFIIFAAKGRHELRGKRDTDVWDIPALHTMSDRRHPTQKPDKLPAFAIEHSSDSGDIVTDWFAGSGTTGIACHQLGRRARMVEIDPGYCAVILERFKDIGVVPKLIEQAVAIDRWATATGKTPTLCAL